MLKIYNGIRYSTGQFYYYNLCSGNPYALKFHTNLLVFNNFNGVMLRVPIKNQNVITSEENAFAPIVQQLLTAQTRI
jgi:hypothetical protein